MAIYGYARVSTREQNESRQLISIQEFGVDEGDIFLDKQSGKDFHRMEYRKLLKKLKPGDTLVTKSIDRLGRDYGTTTNGDNRDSSRSTLAAVRTRRVNANLYTVSIGIGDMPDGIPNGEQLNAAAWLIRHIRSEVQRIWKTSIPIIRTNIVGHNEITPITKPNCPGRNFPWIDLLSLVAAGNKTITPRSEPETLSPPVQPAQTESAQSEISTYTVVSGDMMIEIARRFGMSLDALATANPQIADLGRISVGQIINIPANSTKLSHNPIHTVVRGDTMSAISRRYGVSLAALAAANPQVENINKIHTGQRISIPR